MKAKICATGQYISQLAISPTVPEYIPPEIVNELGQMNKFALDRCRRLSKTPQQLEFPPPTVGVLTDPESGNARVA